MYVLYFCFLGTAVAISNQAPSTVDSVTVYPVVFEDREDSQRKVVAFEHEHLLELKRASVLAPRLLLRDYAADGTSEKYVDGAYYERHLYENAAHEAALLLKPQGRGHYHIAGLINSTHFIEPLRNHKDFMGRTLHVMSRIPAWKEDAYYKMIKVKPSTNANAPLPEARTKPGGLVVEVAIISDYLHTLKLRQQSLKGLEYIMTYMYKVSLELQQLEPPLRIAVVGYQTTSKTHAEYVSLLQSGVLDADDTVTKLRQYAPKGDSTRKSDLVILITGAKLRDLSARPGAPEMLGIAPLEGICSQYSVAVVKDLAGRYSGVHSTVHEMGHSLGSYHDGEGTSAKCPARDGYIMSPTSHGTHSSEFSQCSKTAITKYITSGDTQCLRYASATHALGFFPRAIVTSLREHVSQVRKVNSAERENTP
ncbi:venom metalloproteinase antarease-like TtrivMP_A [Dermacentor silvarum]|uniref:venom metalloproteinase antarease-like TtrivMP_A n=1 Tax=Dermacentor silvarum TaxID=543639 RepID=UPI001897FB8F|nr:venom metalloproteinase antarease-like TtrivMP_A [Dermacentor silvarum]